VGPSTKIYISIPNMSGFKDYLQSDVIHFMAEKPLSQTAPNERRLDALAEPSDDDESVED
jgi:hypothetical protein